MGESWGEGKVGNAPEGMAELGSSLSFIFFFFFGVGGVGDLTAGHPGNPVVSFEAIGPVCKLQCRC